MPKASASAVRYQLLLVASHANFASKMTYIVSGGALNSTHSLTLMQTD